MMFAISNMYAMFRVDVRLIGYGYLGKVAWLRGGGCGSVKPLSSKSGKMLINTYT